MRRDLDPHARGDQPARRDLGPQTRWDLEVRRPDASRTQTGRPAAPNDCTLAAVDSVAKLTERTTTATARAAATTQPAARLTSACRTVSARRCRFACRAAGAVIGGGPPGAR